MAIPRVLVLRAPGTNCDHETKFAFEQAGGSADRVHINRLLENPSLASEYQILCIPGGISYGDDVAAGRILAILMRNHLSETMQQFKADGKLMLGICNGFQVLIKSGVLLDDDDGGEPATLTWNDHGRYEDRWVYLKVNPETPCIFLQGIEQMYLPIAHAEGKFVTRDQEVFDSLSQSGQFALHYVNSDGSAAEGFPANPNGAQSNIAGACDASGRVLGLMPHPERFLDPLQPPRWTREGLQDEGDGLAIFRNAVQFFA